MGLPYTIPLTGTGGLFTRIGAMGGALNAVNLNRGTTIPTHVTSIGNQFLATNQDVVSGLLPALTTYQSSSGNFLSQLRSMASNTLTEMVNDDYPQINTSLSAMLNYLIADMVANSQTVSKNTVGQSISYGGSNVGNPVAVISLVDASGKALEYANPETFVGTVTNDVFVSPGLAGVEPIVFVGQPSVSDGLSWLYPAGSGTTANLSAISPLATSAGNFANWIANGSMETFTVTNVPDSWHIIVGSAGTQFLRTTGAGTFYDGSSALEIVGDSSTLSQIRQQFSLPSGAGDMRPTLGIFTQVAVNLFIKLSSTPAAGVLRVALTDGTSVINDAAGNPNDFTVTLSSLGGGWHAVNGTFRTPSTLPTVAYLDLKLTTALSTGSNLYVDRVGLAQMSQLYRAGPFLSLFSGNVNMLRGDQVFATITNDLGGGFQSLFWKLFNMPSLNLILPSATSGSETIHDSLIA